MDRIKRSIELFNESKFYLPGGVNSPVRAFKGVGGNPLFIRYSRGSKIFDVDDNPYIDYVCSWGPLILGHADPRVVEAVKKAAEAGMTYGAPTEQELVLARMVCEAVPSMQMVRMVNSGTEAVMSAIRLARAFTGRNKILKFSGCYHGHSDGLLVKAGSGAATLGVPDSAGVPPEFAAQTLTSPYNQKKEIAQIFARYGRKIAAVIVEPVAANMGLVLPIPGFLEDLRRLTRDHGSLLIFDEVITGFRLAYGGAQSVYNIQPDLTCLGKIIGGGLPVGAYGGRREIMEMVSPSGPVYQAGTLSGNPVAMAAGIETLKIIGNLDIYYQLKLKGELLIDGLAKAINKTGIQAHVAVTGSLFTIFFSASKVTNYAEAARSDTVLYGRFFHEMLKQGIYLPPSQFETSFISTAHSEADIQMTIEAAYKAMKALA